jgi:NAD(P)H-nitrite reductase large subunit
MKKVVIVGNGVAGATFARELRKQDLAVSRFQITLISDESKLFFSRTALMYVYMGHMTQEHIEPYAAKFWKDASIDLIFNKVTEVSPDLKSISFISGEKMLYDELILATGSKPRDVTNVGADLKGIQGLYFKKDLASLPQSNKECKAAVIAGGGLIGIELAEMLLSRNIEVHFLIREAYFWSSVIGKREGEILQKHFDKHHGITFHYNTEIEEFLGTDHLSGIKTKTGEIIDCEFAGITIGVECNISWLNKSAGIETNRGILVNDLLETSVPNIYAIGDCIELRTPKSGRRAIEPVWYTGKKMGEALGKTLAGNKTEYNPGHWFNSAKFFDLEYQTYGNVYPNLMENQSEFIWTNAKETILLRFIFNTDSNRFVGVNTFGIRLRHELFGAWLSQEATMDEVLQDLKSANFDPEFYKSYETEIISNYNQLFSKTLKVNKKVWWKNLINQ